MPDPNTFDFEKYAVGGCCIIGDGTDPDVRCKDCGWSGHRDKLEELRQKKKDKLLWSALLKVCKISSIAMTGTRSSSITLVSKNETS